MKNRCLRTIVLLTVTLASFGCATYVNIPAQRGDVASHNPNDWGVLAAQCEAIRALVVHWRLSEPFAVRTLPGTEPASYFALLSNISEYATADEVEGRKVVEVKQLYIRPDGTGQVDMVWWTSDSLEWISPEVETGEVEAPASDVSVVIPPRTGGGEAPEAQTMVTVYLKWGPISGWHSQRIKVWNIPIDNVLASRELR